MFRPFIFVFMLTIALPAAAQTPNPARPADTTQAPVHGVVRDSSGGEVPGATVRIVNEATRAAAETVTDARGAFAFPSIEPGRYRVELTFDGFEAVSRQVAVAADRPTAVDVGPLPARAAVGGGGTPPRGGGGGPGGA